MVPAFSCLIAVNNLAVASGMPTPPIPLSGKSTTVTVTVTSADTLANSTYTLSISSAGGNDQTDGTMVILSLCRAFFFSFNLESITIAAALASLAPSVSKLTPAFSPTTSSYGITLPRTQGSITLTASTHAAGATMTSDDGNGLPKPMQNGQKSSPLQIDPTKSSSTLYVEVTAADKKTKSEHSNGRLGL